MITTMRLIVLGGVLLALFVFGGSLVKCGADGAREDQAEVDAKAAPVVRQADTAINTEIREQTKAHRETRVAIQGEVDAAIRAVRAEEFGATPIPADHARRFVERLSRVRNAGREPRQPGGGDGSSPGRTNTGPDGVVPEG